MVEIGDLSARLEVEGLSQFTGDLGRARSEAEETGQAVDDALDVDVDEATSRIGGFGTALAGAGVAAAAAGVAIVGSALSAGRELRGLSQAARLNVEDLQAMGAVARQTGGDVEDIADASRELQLRLAEATSLGTGPAVDALNLLGLSIADIQNLNPEQSFALIRDRLSEIEDPAQRAFLAEELLGGSTERLTGFLETNAEAFREQIAAVEASGQVLSADAVDANARAADAIDAVTSAGKALAGELVANLAPAIEGIAGSITTWTGSMAEARLEHDRIEPFMEEANRLVREQATETRSATVGWTELRDRMADAEEVAAGLADTQETVLEGLRAYQEARVADALAAEALEAEALTDRYAELALAAGAAYRARFGLEEYRDATTARAGQVVIPGSGELVGTRGDPSRNLRFELAELTRTNVAALEDVLTGPGRTPSGSGEDREPVTKKTAEELAAEKEARDEMRFFEELETLYANNRLNDLQYEALLTSNDLGETLGGLVETATVEELRALDQVRRGLLRVGEIDALGSRLIVQAIGALAAALAGGASTGPGGGGSGVGFDGGTTFQSLSEFGLAQTRAIIRNGRIVGTTSGSNVGVPGYSASDYAADPVGFRRRQGGFDTPSPITVNVMVDGETLATGQTREIQGAMDRGELTVRTTAR